VLYSTVGKLNHDQPPSVESVIFLVHTYTEQTNRHSDSLFASRLSFSSHCSLLCMHAYMHACRCMSVDHHRAETMLMLFVLLCLLLKSRRKLRREDQRDTAAERGAAPHQAPCDSRDHLRRQELLFRDVLSLSLSLLSLSTNPTCSPLTNLPFIANSQHALYQTQYQLWTPRLSINPLQLAISYSIMKLNFKVAARDSAAPTAH